MAAGKRTSLATLAGAKVDDVPGQSDPLLLTLPLAKMVPTRFNPRRNFGTEEQLRDFGLVLKKRQLQPAVVVSRSGYLKLWPEEADHVGDAPYVIANGERRYRGSLAAGLTTLDVVHNEQVAASRGDFLDAVMSENIDREDLDPIERALGIETMVQQLGGADKVAAYYGKTNGWVSQQRKLLKLAPDLQDLVSSREMPIRVGRNIAGLPQDEQAAAWRGELEGRSSKKEEVGPRGRAAARNAVAPPTRAQPDAATPPAPAALEDGTRFTAVKRDAEPPPVPDPRSHPEPPDLNAVPEARTQAQPEVESAAESSRSEDPPEPRQVGAPPPSGLPWESVDAVAEFLIEHMSSSDIRRLTVRLIEHNTMVKGSEQVPV
jgi:ParB family chromosome partitioning protein